MWGRILRRSAISCSRMVLATRSDGSMPYRNSIVVHAHNSGDNSRPLDTGSENVEHLPSDSRTVHAFAGLYCMSAGEVEFTPLFMLYTVSVAFFMPSIGLNNSVAFNALTKTDSIRSRHSPIRTFGTIGFICAMLLVNFAGPADARFQTTYMQLFVSAAFSFIMMIYSLTMPVCPVSKGSADSSLAERLGLRAFSLFKDKKMAIFFIFSMMLGVSLQITNGYANPYITFFKEMPQYADAWAARNANALISLSQVSETLCILLIPFCLKRFGIKG